MAPLPRAVCPTCGVDVALRVGGELREHRGEHGGVCVSAGYTVEQVEAKIEAEVEAIKHMGRS